MDKLGRIPLYHKIFGEGDPLVVLHGLFGMSDNWASFAREMSRYRMVVLIDLRDHGRSPHTGDFNYTLLAEDVAGVMEDNWIYHADILGHSMGGKTAIQLTSMHSSLVRKLIVVDIGPGKNTNRHDIIFKAIESVNLETLESRGEAEEIIGTYIKERAVVRFLMKNLARERKEGFRWKFNVPLLHSRYEDILSEIRMETIDVPSLFIKGEYSNYLGNKEEELIKAHFTNYRIKEIKEAGHWVHSEQPEIFFEAVFDFLQ